jgi:hypothetical protein
VDDLARFESRAYREGRLSKEDHARAPSVFTKLRDAPPEIVRGLVDKTVQFRCVLAEAFVLEAPMGPEPPPPAN